MRKILLAAVACTAFAGAVSPIAYAGLDPFVGEVPDVPIQLLSERTCVDRRKADPNQSKHRTLLFARYNLRSATDH